MIWADGYGGGSSSGVSLGIPHSDFIVTLGLWNGGLGGNDDQKVGTFIHELGHNLGRMHGGSEHVNFKPNHLSIMNYAFQTRGILKDGRRLFEYQRFPLPTLNEDSLSEQNGLGGSSDLAGYFTITDGRFAAREVRADGPIDWNNDGTINPGRVRVNLNGDDDFTLLRATPDEWSAIVYNGGSIGSLAPLDAALRLAADQAERLPFEELTEDQDRRIEDARRKAPARRGDGQVREAPQEAPLRELDEATDRRVEEGLRKSARPPR